MNVNAVAYPKTANLTYTPTANQSGTALIHYHLHDNGGTTPGVDVSGDASFTITINAVNDPPVVVAPAAYSAMANMKVTGLTGLLGVGGNNVTDADTGTGTIPCVPTPFTVTNGSISATSPAGGIVSSVNLTTGAFDFDPPPGATGAVTFTYTVSDTGCPGVGISAPVTVTVNVGGPVIWFVNPAAVSNGTGTLSNPFNLLASANTAIGINSNQRIFVYSGTTTSGVGVTQSATQWLIGQGATNVGGTTNFDTLMGITPPANTIARPPVNGTKPTIQGRVAMNGSNTRVQGVAIAPPAGTQGLTATNGSAPGSGTAMTGMQVGVSATQSDVTVTTTGQNGSNAMGVSLNNAGGVFSLISVNVNQDASANKPNRGISVASLATGSFTILGSGTTAGSGGTIQNATNNGVEFKTANNITLKNMNLTNNAQTNGEANPTLCGATGLNGQNVNCTADVYLGTVSGITLDNVNINGSNQNGINGLNVVDLKIQNGSIVQNCGNESGESGVFIQNLTGLNNALTNSTFSGNRDWQFAVADFTSGALGNAGNPFNVSGCTFIGKGNTTTSEDGFFALIRGTTTANINIGGGSNTPSHFKSNFSYGVFATTADTASATLTVNGCDFGTGGSTTYNNSGIGTGISGASTLNYTFSNNTIIGVAVGTPGNGVGIVATTGTTTPGASIIGTISGNTIGDAAISGSGGFNNAAAMQLLANGGGPMIYKATVTGNHIHNPTALGIQYIGGTTTGAVTGTLHINSNDISTDNVGPPAGAPLVRPSRSPRRPLVRVARSRPSAPTSAPGERTLSPGRGMERTEIESA